MGDTEEPSLPTLPSKIHRQPLFMSRRSIHKIIEFIRISATAVTQLLTVILVGQTASCIVDDFIEFPERIVVVGWVSVDNGHEHENGKPGQQKAERKIMRYRVLSELIECWEH